MCGLEECYIKPGSTNNRQSLSCLLRKVDPVSAHIVLLRVKGKAGPGKNSLELQREAEQCQGAPPFKLHPCAELSFSAKEELSKYLKYTIFKRSQIMGLAPILM